ncbi:MAG: hypothetical protein JOZ39_12155, partial [Chloroflexi bacterium]|nr:hypothetical protein [Chloroflexota bacterium]
PDIIQLTQTLSHYRQPGDIAVLHAFWELGYLDSHAGGGLPAVPLDNIETGPLPGPLDRYQRVWLSMYGTPPDPPQHPLEAWLNRNWARAAEWQFGPNRLTLYVHPLSQAQPLPARFDAPPLTVSAVATAPAQAFPGGSAQALIHWQIARPVDSSLTTSLRLTDDQGRRWAGYDSEPQGGLTPTTAWPVGTTVPEQTALLVPWDIAPGPYNLELSAYRTSDHQEDPLADGGRGPGGGLLAGRVSVQPLQSPMPAHQVTVALDPSLELIGLDLDVDTYQVASQTTVRLAGTEQVQDYRPRQAFRPGESVNPRLYWRKLTDGGPEVTVGLQLAGSLQTVTSSDAIQLRWGARAAPDWKAGEVAITTATLQLPKDLAPGNYWLTLTGGAGPARLVQIEVSR